MTSKFKATEKTFKEPFQEADFGPVHPQSPRSPGLNFPPENNDNTSWSCAYNKTVIFIRF